MTPWAFTDAKRAAKERRVEEECMLAKNKFKQHQAR